MIKDIEGLITRVTNEIAHRTDKAVIGLSGGADSTLCALLCVRALGAENVHGVHMPCSEVDLKKFNSNSVKLSDHLKINSHMVPLFNQVSLLHRGIVEGNKWKDLSQLNIGNMRSRMRMIVLYSVCCAVAEETGKRVRVIGTGNLSEDFIGYDTKGGDALADFFPIGSLVKSEVYQLLDYFRDQGKITEEMINRVPSAGLWDGQTDEDELGYTYAEMEPCVLNFYNKFVRCEGKTPAWDYHDPIYRFVSERYINNKHKHEAPPAIELREFCVDFGEE